MDHGTVPPTPRQRSLLRQLERAGRELSGQQLHRLLQENGEAMGLATVYRHLRQLQRQGRVRCRHLPSGEALYAPIDLDRHHLTCVGCGRSRELHACPIHEVELPSGERGGFRLLFHTLEFFGVCENCQNKHLSA